MARIPELTLTLAESGETTTRCEAFRVLSVLVHKFHVASLPYLNRLLAVVMKELERVEKVCESVF